MTDIPLTPTLAAKVLGGLAATSATCCGGYYAYESSYPPFHNKMEKEGFLWSTIDEEPGNLVALGKGKKETLKELEKDWRCSKYLFGEFVTPSTDITNVEKQNGNGSFDVPTPPTISEDQWKGEPVGCLSVDLRHSQKDNKKSAFLKWELALQSGNKGFIYIGFAGFGAIKKEDKQGNNNAYVANTSSSVVFDISKKGDKWEIGNGFSWPDVFSKSSSLSTSSTTSVLISLPNKEYEWKKEGESCVDENCDLNNWKHEEWIGFWEEGSGGKQPTDALNIQIKKAEEGSTTEQHDIWGTPDFDFENSNQGDSQAWKAYVEAWYDGTTKTWKDMNSMGNAQEYLKASYSPWAQKKGSWTKASETCKQSYSRHLSQKEANRLTKFCYKKKPTSGT